MAARNPRKLSLYLTATARDALTEVAEEEFTSAASVVRRAIAFYEFEYGVVRSGGRVYVESDGQVDRVHFL